jgi:hypothetical protein
MPTNVDEMTKTMIRNLEEKTGKNLDQWIQIVGESEITKHKEIINYLKSEYGLTYGYANLIAQKAREKTGEGPKVGEELVEAQYAGGKSHLRPIYEAVIKGVSEFGNDLEIAPKKTYVSLRRSKQFAIIQPSTMTRVDVGINLKGTEPQGRLEASGSFNAMVSHRVRITQVEEVDDELFQWLRGAFETA